MTTEQSNLCNYKKCSSRAYSTGIGIFGGTFNPIHLGHLIIAGKVRESLNLEKIIFVPARYPPHKKAPEIGGGHRYRMVKLAIPNNSYFVASKIELEREGPSYTIDTVNALKKMYLQEKDFYFILGLDAYLETGSWKEIEKLKKLIRFVVVKRPGYENNSKFKTTKSLRARPVASHCERKRSNLIEVRDCHDLRSRNDSIEIATSSAYSVDFLAMTPIAISSTEIRSRIKKGESVQGLLPDKVMDYIRQHHLYE